MKSRVWGKEDEEADKTENGVKDVMMMMNWGT